MTKWETLVAVVNLLNLPLLVSSSARLPISSMPDWLQGFANIAPTSKGADAARTLIIKGTVDPSVLGADMTYLIGFATILTIIGTIASVTALRTEWQRTIFWIGV